MQRFDTKRRWRPAHLPRRYEVARRRLTL